MSREGARQECLNDGKEPDSDIWQNERATGVVSRVLSEEGEGYRRCWQKNGGVARRFRAVHEEGALTRSQFPARA